MSKNYQVSGTINAYPIKTKCFKDSAQALRYLDRIVTENDLQIEEVFTTEGVMTTYVANHYSRFNLTKIA